MFQVQQFINHRYTPVGRSRSIGGAGLVAQNLTKTGRFIVTNSKGKTVLKGLVTHSGKVRFDK